MKPFDIAVIGAGPTGVSAALRAADQGAHVCIIEQNRIGGSCFRKGLYPFKAALATLKNNEPRVTINGVVDIGRLSRSVAKTIASISQKWEERLTELGVKIQIGRGIPLSSALIQIESGGEISEIHTKKIIIATGSRPVSIPTLPFEGDNKFRVAPIIINYNDTPIGEKRYYMFSINNVFQAKIRNEKGDYNKGNFLTWYSFIKYNPLKQDGPRLDEMESIINIKNLSGKKLVGISMRHNFYKSNNGELVDLLNGEFPSLTYIKLSTNLRFNLSGLNIDGNETINSVENSDAVNYENYNKEEININNQKSRKKWETQLDFRYGTDWNDLDNKWDYTLSLYTTHSFNLSDNWSVSYTADFNVKEREIIRNKISIKRPIHCWEFSFNYWPGNTYSSGFSLQINVKNPDLRDIKITSKDVNRGFGSF